MELKGRVNEYNHKFDGTRVYTLNLAFGVTPFVITHRGTQYHSNFYRLSNSSVEVEKVFYRPNKAEFDAADKIVQHHILNGGLLLGSLGTQSLVEDPTRIDTEFEEFQNWCQSYYGSRLKSFHGF